MPQYQGVFQWVGSSHQVAKVLEFQLQHQSFQWTPRTDLLEDGLVGSPCSPRDSQESSPTPQFIFCCKEYNQSDFNIGHLVMSMYRVVPVLLEEGVCYDQYVLLTKLLAFVLLYFVLQRPTLPFTPDILTSYLCIPIPLWWKGHLFLVLALEGLIGLHRTDQIQFLRPQWWRHRLGLLWCSIVCLGNEPRSFCHFWDCTQVLHFRLFLTIRATPFLLWDSCPQ